MENSFIAWIPAIAFFFAQNIYFGWNWSPKSDTEIICDGIGLLLCALAIIGQK